MPDSSPTLEAAVTRETILPNGPPVNGFLHTLQLIERGLGHTNYIFVMGFKSGEVKIAVLTPEGVEKRDSGLVRYTDSGLTGLNSDNYRTKIYDADGQPLETCW